MSNYGYMRGVEPKWLSRFLGHKYQTITVATLLLTIPAYTGRALDLFISCGALVGLLLSPDLDLSYSRLGLFGRLSLADEYTQLVRHRSSISHAPLIGTAGRVFIVILPVVVIIYLMSGFRLGLPIVLSVVYRMFVGLAWADTWHWALDWISSNVVTKTRKG